VTQYYVVDLAHLLNHLDLQLGKTTTTWRKLNLRRRGHSRLQDVLLGKRSNLNSDLDSELLAARLKSSGEDYFVVVGKHRLAPTVVKELDGAEHPEVEVTARS